MKKWVSILLLSLYLLSTTELNQLLKLPVLIEHYVEHKYLKPEIPLVSVFKMHYDHPVKDADYKTDRKLPFIIHSTLSLVFTLNTNFSFEISGSDHKYYRIQNIPSLDENLYIKGYLHSIWQPPRA